MQAKWEDMAVVGRVARPHGIRGQVIVNPDTDFPEDRFRPGAQLFVTRAGHVEPVTVTTARFHRGRPVIGLHGVEDMNAAATLSGAELRVPVGELAALPGNVYYRHDLVGCSVETATGEIVGTVADVEGTMAGSRLVVRTTRGDVLVPLVAAFCPRIDTGGKRIVVSLPDGLLELNR